MLTKKTIIKILAATGVFLLIPLVAMQFVEGMSWGFFDFILAGIMLSGTGIAYAFISKKYPNVSYKIATALGLATAFLLIWVNLAVGLIGNEANPANLLYNLVLLVGLVGVLWAKFEPRKMTHAMFATAVAQATVPFIAMVIWRPEVNTGMVAVLGINTFFVVLWCTTALLFRGVRI